MRWMFVLTACLLWAQDPVSWGVGNIDWFYNYNDLWITPTGEVWACGDSGLIRKPDGSYINLDANYNFYGICVQGNRIFVVGEDLNSTRPDPSVNIPEGIFLKLDLSGNILIRRTSLDIDIPPSPFYDVKFVNEISGWVACANGYILSTRDGGGTWEAHNFSEISGNLISRSNSFLCIDTDGNLFTTAWAVADNRGWYVWTTDGGNTWNYPPSPPDTELTLFNIQKFGAYAYVATSHGKWMSIDNTGSAVIYDLFVPGTEWGYGISDPYHAGSAGIIWKGSTIRYASGRSDVVWRCIWENADTGFVAGKGGIKKFGYFSFPLVQITAEPDPSGYTCGIKVSVTVSPRLGEIGTIWVVRCDFDEIGPYTDTVAIFNFDQDTFQFSVLDLDPGYDRNYYYKAIVTSNLTGSFVWLETYPYPVDWSTPPLGCYDLPSYPPNPSNFSASNIPDDDGNCIKLSWSQVTSADGYYIYRKAEYEPEFRFIWKASSLEDHFIDDNVANGVSYAYQIRSYVWDPIKDEIRASTGVVASAISSDEKAPPLVQNVNTYTETDTQYTRFWIKWDHVPYTQERNLAGYEVCPEFKSPTATALSLITLGTDTLVGTLRRSQLIDRPHNPALIERNFYLIEFPTPLFSTWMRLKGALLAGGVRAVDRSENIGPWSGTFYLKYGATNPNWNKGWFYAYIPGPGLTDILPNNTKRVYIDQNNNIHVFYSYKGIVWHSFLPEGATEWVREKVVDGEDPAAVVIQNTVYIIYTQKGKEGFLNIRVYNINSNGALIFPPIATARFKITSTLTTQVVPAIYPTEYPVTFGPGAPSFAIKRDTGYAVLTRAYGERQGETITLKGTHLIFAKIPLLSPENTIFEQIDYQPFMIAEPSFSGEFPDSFKSIFRSPTVTVDRLNGVHIVWDKPAFLEFGGPIRPAVVIFSPLAYYRFSFDTVRAQIIDNEAYNPYLRYEAGKIHLVYARRNANYELIYRTLGITYEYIPTIERFPPPPGELIPRYTEWSEPVIIDTSGYFLDNPFYEKGKIIYNKFTASNAWVWNDDTLKKVVFSEIYDVTRDLRGVFTDIRKITKSEPVSSINPQFALRRTRRINYFNYMWSAYLITHSGLFYRADTNYANRIVQVAEILGNETPSTYTLQREGYLIFGDSLYQRADYDTNALIYFIPDIQSFSQLWVIFKIYNGLEEDVKLKFYVDKECRGEKWISSGEYLEFTTPIPSASLRDSSIFLKVECEKGPFAILSGFAILGKTGRRRCEGPQSSSVQTENIKFGILSPTLVNNRKIKFAVDFDQNINLDIYDITGRKIINLFSGLKEKGIYELPVPSEFSKGVYFIILKGKYKEEKKKIVLVK